MGVCRHLIQFAIVDQVALEDDVDREPVPHARVVGVQQPERLDEYPQTRCWPYCWGAPWRASTMAAAS